MSLKKRINSDGAVDRARRLRRDSTVPENLFWSRVKNRQLLSLKFRKQHPIGPFVVDFYCASENLVVEIDGESHVDEEADAERQRCLEGLGLWVVRYLNDDVLKHLDAVMADLEAKLRERWEKKRIPPLAPPFEGGE